MPEKTFTPPLKHPRLGYYWARGFKRLSTPDGTPTGWTLYGPPSACWMSRLDESTGRVEYLGHGGLVPWPGDEESTTFSSLDAALAAHDAFVAGAPP